MTDTTYTPPKLREPGGTSGHAVLTAGREGYSVWGPTTLRLYGTPAEPQLSASTPMRGNVSILARRDDLARFAREVLAFLGEDYGVRLPPWHPASDGAGERPWFLCRYPDGSGQDIPLEDRYRYSAAGVLVRYASKTAALRAADKLNAQEASS